jgi:thioredoxin reductase
MAPAPPSASGSPDRADADRAEDGVTADVDVVIVGGGPAGLSAALTLGRVRRSTAVIDAGEPRNAPASHVHGMLTRDCTSPLELRAIGREEVARYGTELLDGRAVGAHRRDDSFVVTLDDGRRVRGRHLLLASGLVDELPDVPGIEARWGRDVVHCPFCHGWEFRDLPLAVLATGPAATHGAMLLRQLSDDVTLVVHAGDGPDDPNLATLTLMGVAVRSGPVVELRIEDDELRGLRLADGTELPAAALLVAPRFVARGELLASLGLSATPHPGGVGEQVEADGFGRTDVPGVWVAGNVNDLMANVALSIAAGVRAASAIVAQLLEDDLARASAG